MACSLFIDIAMETETGNIGRNMVSIKDVAREAGVAISTVSKVLNNYPNVSEETKRKVNEVVDRLGFVPNTVAATLSSKRTGRIALMLKLNTKTNAGDEINMQYISGAIQKARELQLDIITIFYNMIQDLSLEETVQYLSSQGIRGLIICGMSKEDKLLHQLIDSGQFKIVVIDAPFWGQSTSCVSVDQERAQYDIAKKTIIENTCKRVLYIAGPTTSYTSDLRLEGMNRLAEEMKLKLYVRRGNYSELEARRLTMKYSKNKDIVVCASDLMAIGAVKALTEMDIFRPVCGFDGIILMGYVGMQMNTVQQDFAGICGEAVAECNRLMSGEHGRRVILNHKLVRMKYEDIIC